MGAPVFLPFLLGLPVFMLVSGSISILAFLLCLFLLTLRGGHDAVYACFRRHSWTTRWTVTTSGKRRSLESLCPTAKG